MNNRPKIGMNDTVMDIIAKMSEGNPGAINAMMAILQQDQVMGFMRLLSLDDMGMRGSQIWVAFKDHCNGDVDAFIKAIDDRDAAMVATVNASRGHAPGTPQAVAHGASFA